MTKHKIKENKIKIAMTKATIVRELSINRPVSRQTVPDNLGENYSMKRQTRIKTTP